LPDLQLQRSAANTGSHDLTLSCGRNAADDHAVEAGDNPDHATAYGRLSGAVAALLAGWSAYRDGRAGVRLSALEGDVRRLADVLASCEEGLRP
jgi:hypothetical protein